MISGKRQTEDGLPRFLIDFFADAIGSGAPIVNHLGDEFDTLDQAWQVAKSSADMPKVQANSFAIESEAAEVLGRWARAGFGWEKLDA
jgi:hypothetical protein